MLLLGQYPAFADTHQCCLPGVSVRLCEAQWDLLRLF